MGVGGGGAFITAGEGGLHLLQQGHLLGLILQLYFMLNSTEYEIFPAHKC